MRVNIFEFDGSTLNPEGFIDWLVAVEEVFEFKEVPENKRVSLIATKLRGRASAWWQQLKLTRESWKAKSHQLEEDEKGTKSVEDYKIEFCQLIARNDIQDTDDQLVSRYIGGLRVQIMDSVNMFDQTKVGGGNDGPVSKGVRSNGLKCFNCGEPGHQQSECKKAGKRHLFVDEEWEDNGVADDDYKEPLVFDDDQYEEETVSGDVEVNLMVRPWEYDRNTTHYERANTYSFMFDGVKITLMSNKPKELVNKPTSTLLTLSKFQDKLEMGNDVFVLIGREVAKDSKIPETINSFTYGIF
nr:hypothetical protein [Tanacetum cinerariifolium]